MTNNHATFVVTGGIHGIGLATSNLLRSIGLRTIICDCEIVKDKDFIFVDLADKKSIIECTESIPNGIEGIINCAGVAPIGQPNSRVLYINWFGTRLFTEQLIGKVAPKGSVTTVASRAGDDWEKNILDIEPIFNCSFDDRDSFGDFSNLSAARAYEISKELLILWSMMNATTNDSIRFNTVSPSSVKTRLSPSFKEAFKYRKISSHKLRKTSTLPEEIAQAIWFLANPKNQSVNGIDLKVDQGITAKHKIFELEGIQKRQNL